MDAIEPVAIHLMPVSFNRSAIRAATLGRAMPHKLAQRLRDLFLSPLWVARSKRRSFELAHFFHELQADLEPLCRGHPA
jgi:hypothetical protein